MGRQPRCPECGSRGYLIVPGHRVYGRSSRYRHRRVAVCRNETCDARAGVHEAGPHRGKPMGTLAGEPTRRARREAHAAFDPLWRHGSISREGAYRALAFVLGIPVEDCHIGQFDTETCGKVVEWARKVRGRAVFAGPTSR